MRIAVIGAGAIGGTVAALLDRAGHEVTITARGAQLEVIRASGLRISGGWGEHTAHPRASSVLDGTPDMAFVCTKAQDAGGAITANATWLGGIPVAIVQNGLDAITVAEKVLTTSDVVGAIALYAASYLEPGVVTVTAAGPTFVGSDSEGRSSAAELVAATLGAAMPTILTDDFRGVQWSKLIVNQVNAMPAITGLSAQETLEHPVLLGVITAGMREAVRVGLASGIRFASLQGLSQPLLRAFSVAPLRLGSVLPRVMARRMGHIPNPGSTLQSIRRGQQTEIDFLNGAVVRAAEAIGRDAPINRALTALVHGVEKSGDFLRVEDVAAHMPAKA